ncbi:MAG: hypothetical protein ACRC0X_09340 [Brevinema sp.]
MFILEEKFDVIMHHLERCYEKAPKELQSLHSSMLLSYGEKIETQIVVYSLTESSKRTMKMVFDMDNNLVVLIKKIKRTHKYRRNCMPKYRYDKIIDLSTECFKILNTLKSKK